jgi:tryptophan 2,3-dioxygenase
LVHYKAAVRYLYKKPKELDDTGRTNWQQYLPPRNQKILFFPELWSKEEFKNWGEDLIEDYTFLAEDQQNN